jgi:hypothetical protein
MPSFCSPSIDDSTGGTVDMTKDTNFSCQVNGNQIDSYQLMIKKLDNTILYDSSNSTEILNSNVGITYNGTWSNSTNQRIDDTNSNIIYYGYGWNTYTSTANGYYGNTVHNSGTMNDYLTYDFIGTGINCYFTKGRYGICQIYIDGIDKGIIDLYLAHGSGVLGNDMQQLCYSIDSLPLGVHTIKIVVTGTKNANSTQANIEFDYFQIINTNGAKNSNKRGDSFSYTFNNTGVNVYMDKTPNSGIIDVQIDGVSKATIDLYSNNYTINTLVYSNLNLSSGNHTIKIIVTGNKNTQSKDSYCYFDKLKILSKTILPSKIYDKKTLNIIISANTIAYKGQMKWQLTYWNSDNDGESVTSGEFVFFNMTTPVVGINVGDIVNNKQFNFIGNYSQSEKVNIKKWNMTLYAQNYKINCGFVEQVSNGTNLDCGDINSIPSRYYIDCGEL